MVKDKAVWYKKKSRGSLETSVRSFGIIILPYLEDGIFVRIL
jgi:hypothetical protein